MTQWEKKTTNKKTQLEIMKTQLQSQNTKTNHKTQPHYHLPDEVWAIDKNCHWTNRLSAF